MYRRLAWLPLTIALLSPLAALPPRTSDFAARLSRVEAMAAAEWGQDRIASLTIAVLERGKLVWTKSYGDAEMEERVPAGKDTVYRVGSITKQVTAVMLSQLVERGRVHLSDPVQRYVPEIHRIRDGYPAAAPVTLFELATHTSGLAREPDNYGLYLRGPVAEWKNVLLAALPHTHFLTEPGIYYFYSNVDYALLGLALERAAGRPYVDYVQANILRPLGMNQTAFVPNPAIRSRLATGYAVVRGKPDPAIPARELHGRGYKVPNGGLFSTVGDLARFAALWFGEAPESVLKKKTLDAMLAQVVMADSGLTRGYGRGFMVWRRGDIVAFGHGGSVAGYLAALYLDLPSRTGVIVLANQSGGRARPSSLAIRALRVLCAN
ncbi:MAG: serine hydrolase domain-containing protein [Bryobacteraceae bacterium]